MENNTKNDSKILLLRKQIEEKKKKLGKRPKFEPITNCSLILNDQRFNLHVLSLSKCKYVLIVLNSFLLSSKDLDIKDYSWEGYLLEDWIKDLKSRLNVLEYNAEIARLKKLEEKLDKLLSEEKQTELTLGEIENEI